MKTSEIHPKVKAQRLDSGALKREATLLRAMFVRYCQDHHGSRDNNLCDECTELLRYSLTRLACCPFGQEKPTCARCKIHCYRAQEKDSVRAIMRYSGPKMMLPHPLLTLEHLIKNHKEAPEKPRNRKAQTQREGASD